MALLSEETRTVAAFYRRLCTKFEYPFKLFPRIVYEPEAAPLIPALGSFSQHSSNINMASSSSRPNLRGPVELSSFETKWRDRQPFLESKGYMLRPRLRPGWTPSWLSTGRRFFDCEDSVRLPVS